ncbi:MAG: response regulator transcription factor [Flavobacterium sp.]|nr:response regulator transcription factor [Flavobacterium sp.]
MAKEINILLVDDHPMTLDGYINLLSEFNTDELMLTFTTAHNCTTAYTTIMNFSRLKKDIDFAYLDISLPPYKEMNIESGVDLALLIREKFPKCKIALLTMHNEPVLIDKIMNKVNPEAFISKCDINFEMFPNVFEKIYGGETFASHTISNALKELMMKNIKWDSIDSQILLLISQGVKTADLPNYIPLSMSALEKRKANIKSQLLRSKGGDKELIEEAKKIGLI